MWHKNALHFQWINNLFFILFTRHHHDSYFVFPFCASTQLSGVAWAPQRNQAESLLNFKVTHYIALSPLDDEDGAFRFLRQGRPAPFCRYAHTSGGCLKMRDNKCKCFHPIEGSQKEDISLTKQNRHVLQRELTPLLEVREGTAVPTEEGSLWKKAGGVEGVVVWAKLKGSITSASIIELLSKGAVNTAVLLIEKLASK